MSMSIFEEVMEMKEFAVFAVLMLSVLFVAGRASAAEPKELVVFGAASMTETLTRIADLYKKVEPDVKLTFNFDSSGTLKSQIEEGAVCDVFVSASQKQMNQLDIASEKNEKKLDFVLEGTRVNLLENRVVLVVPKGNPAKVTEFKDVGTDAVRLVALGNDDVPVGQYSREIFTNMGLWDGMQKKVTFGGNVKEVAVQVQEGAVDCGVVYATDAASAGLTVVASAPEGTLKTPVVYPAAVVKAGKHPEEAKKFLAFLRTPECAEVFEAVGFTVVR